MSRSNGRKNNPLVKNSSKPKYKNETREATYIIAPGSDRLSTILSAATSRVNSRFIIVANDLGANIEEKLDLIDVDAGVCRWVDHFLWVYE